jgi:hypothetical protein
MRTFWRASYAPTIGYHWMTRLLNHARHERGTTLGAVLLIVVVLGAGAAVAFVALRRPTGRRVPVVGDSITVFAGNDIKKALAPKYHAEIHAVFGSEPSHSRSRAPVRER